MSALLGLASQFKAAKDELFRHKAECEEVHSNLMRIETRISETQQRVNRLQRELLEEAQR